MLRHRHRVMRRLLKSFDRTHGDGSGCCASSSMLPTYVSTSWDWELCRLTRMVRWNVQPVVRWNAEGHADVVSPLRAWHRVLCGIGREPECTVRLCPITSLGTLGTPNGFHANPSTLSRRKVLSAPFYLSPGSAPAEAISSTRVELSGDRRCFIDGWADDSGRSTSSEDVVATAL